MAYDLNEMKNIQEFFGNISLLLFLKELRKSRNFLENATQFF